MRETSFKKKLQSVQKLEAFLKAKPHFKRALNEALREKEAKEGPRDIITKEKFDGLPVYIQLRAWEYYALVSAQQKKQTKGENLSVGDRNRLFELLPTITEYNLSADVCGVEL
ncbi:MAG: hypothetical protein ACPG5Z_00370 [Pseudoalteromonas sp.]